MNTGRLAVAVVLSTGIAFGCIGDYDRAWEEGGAYGLSHDLPACWETAFERLQLCDGLSCRADVIYFSSSCAKHAGPDPAFCEPVPDSVFAYVGWIRDACARAGDPSEACEKTLKNIASVCLEQ